VCKLGKPAAEANCQQMARQAAQVPQHDKNSANTILKQKCTNVYKFEPGTQETAA
jgi:hypothetical protein